MAWRPIVIIGMPRSGTSMTAGIFAKHGVWVGETRQGDAHNPKGYFENLAVKRLIYRCAGMKRLTAHNHLVEPVDGWADGIRDILAREGYRGGPWLVKHGAMAWRLWHEFEPNWVCVRRRNSVESARRMVRPGNGLTLREIVDFHRRQMDIVRDRHGGVDVFTDDVVQGDYSSLERAFAHCGLTFDPAIADTFVEPRYWHH